MDNAQLDAYLSQLKQMGMDDATIELYKQQFVQSMQLSAQMMNSGMAQQMAGNMMEQFSQLLDEADEIEMDENTPLTIPQQWAMACGANLSFYNDHTLNTLKTGMDKRTASKQLSEWWGIKKREALLETFNDLEEGGHREKFDLIAQANEIADPDAAAKFFEEKLAGLMDEEDAVEYMQNLREALELFGNDGLLPANGKAPNMMVWDFARIINLCRSGADAGYLSDEEALNAAIAYAQVIQQEYGSWKELSVAYLFARCIWGGCEDYDSWKDGMDTLLSNEKSPWVKLAWNTKL